MNNAADNKDVDYITADETNKIHTYTRMRIQRWWFKYLAPVVYHHRRKKRVFWLDGWPYIWSSYSQCMKFYKQWCWVPFEVESSSYSSNVGPLRIPCCSLPISVIFSTIVCTNLWIMETRLKRAWNEKGGTVQFLILVSNWWQKQRIVKHIATTSSTFATVILWSRSIREFSLLCIPLNWCQKGLSWWWWCFLYDIWGWWSFGSPDLGETESS